jgi:itaconyl-CoA hydratase
MSGAPNGSWAGRLYEDFRVGQRFVSALGRTVTEADNVWLTCLTMNTNQSHFNGVYAARGPYGRPLVNSCLTLALVTGLSVRDTSENATANLGWSDVRMPAPVFVGDTLWARTEVTERRRSRSHPDAGLVTVATEGVKQDDTVVMRFTRTFMVPRKAAAQGGTRR